MKLPKPKKSEIKQIKSRMKKLSKSSAKKRAWTAFSIYIRTRDSINGMCQCITCGKIMPIKEAQAGHFLGGRGGSVLFEEDMVFAQCVGCNVFLRGNYTAYTLKMIDRYGRDWVDAKILQKHQIVKRTAQDYLDLAATYKEKLKLIQ